MDACVLVAFAAGCCLFAVRLLGWSGLAVWVCFVLVLMRVGGYFMGLCMFAGGVYWLVFS